MAISASDKTLLIRWAGINADDTDAVTVLTACYERAKNWYRDAGVPDCADSRTWIMDLASWFYDNRGRSDAVIPAYIVTSVHQLRNE